MVHYCWTKVARTPAIWLVDACIFTERSKAVAFTWWGMATEWTFSMCCIHFGPLSWEKNPQKPTPLMHIATLDRPSWNHHQHQISQLCRNMSCVLASQWYNNCFCNMIIHHSDFWVLFLHRMSLQLFLFIYERSPIPNMAVFSAFLPHLMSFCGIVSPSTIEFLHL